MPKRNVSFDVHCVIALTLMMDLQIVYLAHVFVRVCLAFFAMCSSVHLCQN